MRTPQAIGRFAATCAHPYAAWRKSSAKGRLVILLAYTMIGYVGVLLALVAR